MGLIIGILAPMPQYDDGDERLGYLPPSNSVLSMGCPKHGGEAILCGPLQREERLGEDCPELDRMGMMSSADSWGHFALSEDEDHSSAVRPEETPSYILEESLPSQVLWHMTAGRRPKQPEDERKRWESVWAEQMRRSKTSRSTPELQTPRAHRPHHILHCPYGFAASKSFGCARCSSISRIMLHIPRVRIVRYKGVRSHAEFLVLVDNGARTFGVWRRFSDFHRFHARRVTQSRAFAKSRRHWQALRNRLKWFRCLEHEYLIFKCFLLERYVQQVLADSASPAVLREFIFWGPHRS